MEKDSNAVSFTPLTLSGVSRILSYNHWQAWTSSENVEFVAIHFPAHLQPEPVPSARLRRSFIPMQTRKFRRTALKLRTLKSLVTTNCWRKSAAEEWEWCIKRVNGVWTGLSR